MSGDQRTRSVKRTFGAFKNIRVMICAAIFVGMSILLGKYLPIFNIDILRFSFENLPIILSGILFGPAVGAVVGVVADLVGCVLVGYAINPLVTCGSLMIGLSSGFISYFAVRRFSLWKIVSSVFIAHLLGSVLIKSIGLMAYYAHPLWLLMIIRSANYVLVGSVESMLIFFILRNRAVQAQFNKMMKQ